MNRRDFIRLLGAIPFIPLVSSKEGERKLLGQANLTATEGMVEEERTTVYFTPYLEDKLAVWNGSTWTAFDKSIEFGTEGELYISGDFLLETPKQARQRLFDEYHQNYLEVQDNENA